VLEEYKRNGLVEHVFSRNIFEGARAIKNKV
jgi:hypothetical protein